MTVYRAPTGNFEVFINRLDSILKTLYRADSKLIVCGDINIDYLSDSEKKRQLDAVLLSFIHSFIYLVFQQSTKVDMELVNT